MLVKFVEHQHLIERGLIRPNDNFQMGLFQKRWCTSDGNLEVRPILYMQATSSIPQAGPIHFCIFNTSVYLIHVRMSKYVPCISLHLAMNVYKTKAAGTLEGSVYKT